MRRQKLSGISTLTVIKKALDHLFTGKLLDKPANHFKFVYLQMNNVYINPNGLSGIYQRTSSPEYFSLRDQVRAALQNLEDPETHVRPLSHIWNYENANEAKMPKDRVGDLVIANSAQYNWSEDLSPEEHIFVGTLKGGYKQGIWPQSAEGMLTPFVIMGPGVKKDCVLKEPITHVDQYATIANIFGIHPDYQPQGRVLNEIFENK